MTIRIRAIDIELVRSSDIRATIDFTEKTVLVADLRPGSPSEKVAGTPPVSGDDSASPAEPVRQPRSRAARYALAAGGVVLVGVGAIGAVVPGLPTTIFLIAASYLFARSCPWLEERLIRNRLFAPFLRYVDAPREMPRGTRIAVIAVMWISVLISSWVLLRGEPERLWLPLLIIAAAAVGTWVIARLGSKQPPPNSARL